jgi:hypothetical protein
MTLLQTSWMTGLSEKTVNWHFGRLRNVLIQVEPMLDSQSQNKIRVSQLLQAFDAFSD